MKPLLEVEGLRKAFRTAAGELEVLKGVSFKAEAGRSVAITGPSGCGKSTLLSLLAGLESPSQGEVRVEGRSISGMDEQALASFRGRRIGIVFQSFRLLPTLSALENVKAPLELAGLPDADQRARHWLAQVGLAGRLDHLPSSLSGGEQQRVALARALAPEPALVLADEPTGNLDSESGRRVRKLLFGLVKQSRATLVLVTHDATLAREAGKVLKMRDGRFVR